MNKNISNMVKTVGKKAFRLLLAPALLTPALTACSPEDFEHPSQAGLPSVSGVDFQINVDQSINQVTVQYSQPGTYPLWCFNDETYSTLNSLSKIFTKGGDYKVSLRLGNKNGLSQGEVVKTFHFDKTQVDLTPYINRIVGKEWRIDYSEPGHLGCGPSGTDGTSWWSAGPNEKADFGVYDDRLTFSEDGTYTYSPGEGGTVYVNWGCSIYPEYNVDKDTETDFVAPVDPQTSSYSLDTDADGNVLLMLAPKTLFPYIANDEQWNSPTYRFESVTAKKMVLVIDNGNIAWHFILTSEGEVKAFEGFDPDSDCNMFKTAQNSITFYYADANWSQLPDPALTEGNNSWQINLPTANSSQWQSQMAFHTDMATNAATTYDFSILLTADKDLAGATVKLTQDDNDDIYFFADRVDLKAGEEYVFWKSDMPGVDITNVKLVLDFGGCQENANVEIRNVVLKEHGCDDGTVLPSDQPGGDGPAMDWDYTSEANLWKAVDDGTLFGAFGYWFADDSWGELPTQPVAALNGDTYEITLPEGMGGSQWQGQFHIDTRLTASASKAYNFYLVMEADNDCPGVTFKLTDSGDSNYFIEERNDVKADVPFVLKREGVTLKEGLDAEAIRLFFDFGGSPVGTHVKISKIYFEES